MDSFAASALVKTSMKVDVLNRKAGGGNDVHQDGHTAPKGKLAVWLDLWFLV